MCLLWKLNSALLSGSTVRRKHPPMFRFCFVNVSDIFIENSKFLLQKKPSFKKYIKNFKNNIIFISKTKPVTSQFPLDTLSLS